MTAALLGPVAGIASASATPQATQADYDDRRDDRDDHDDRRDEHDDCDGRYEDNSYKGHHNNYKGRPTCKAMDKRPGPTALLFTQAREGSNLRRTKLSPARADQAARAAHGAG